MSPSNPLHLMLILAASVGACAAQQPQQAPPPAAPSTASAAAPGASDPVRAGPSANPSGEACRGVATPRLVDELRARTTDTRLCYERALRDSPALAGRLVVSVRVTEDGSVAAVEFPEDDLRTDSVRDCARQIFLRPFSTPPERGCLVAVVPIRFKPKPPAGPTGAGP